MTNTLSDDVLFALIEEHFGLKKRQFGTVIDPKTGKFHDAARYRDFASAVLANCGKHQPAPVSEREAEIAMIDAAMVEMANITPPLTRSECARLIRAALAAHGGQ